MPAGGLQTEAQANGTAYGYFQAKGLSSTAQAASYQVSYYESQIAQVQTADDLVGDARLLDVALTSVGLDSSTTSTTFVWQVLTSDPADPDSVLNKMSEATTSDIDRKAKFKASAGDVHLRYAGQCRGGRGAERRCDHRDHRRLSPIPLPDRRAAEGSL